MSLRKYILLMGGATLIAYILLANVIVFFDPSSGYLAVLMLYSALALAVVGTFSILGFLLRHFMSPEEIVFREVITSFRQAIWFAILIVASLALKHIGVFSFLSILLLVGALGSLELYIGNKSAKN